MALGAPHRALLHSSRPGVALDRKRYARVGLLGFLICCAAVLDVFPDQSHNCVDERESKRTVSAVWVGRGGCLRSLFLVGVSG